jgi:FMN-binding domain
MGTSCTVFTLESWLSYNAIEGSMPILPPDHRTRKGRSVSRPTLSRSALLFGIIGLAAGNVLSSPAALAATPPDIFRGPLLDRLRVVVRVSIKVQNGTLIDVRPTVRVRTPRSWFINTQAVPVLRREALTAQSANIQVVSGATVTSEAFITSLRVAMTKARQARAL